MRFLNESAFPYSCGQKVLLSAAAAAPAQGAFVLEPVLIIRRAKFPPARLSANPATRMGTANLIQFSDRRPKWSETMSERNERAQTDGRSDPLRVRSVPITRTISLPQNRRPQSHGNASAVQLICTTALDPVMESGYECPLA